ncbi:hypothetical protein Emtol_2672 [Emticicia oligotrophica DSM 17448]|uniref:DUF4286 family protein n=1 Tax=Emticicia oligotrophica (strain DSM 17448 / CIP 109782 / MTCC 6937 / GPTSA100-15) TaxID=929562 RepID=A0ABM5N341_EMTOG|nr:MULTISPECIES: DUF4286 family protein [Emticicia]AFK03808.1 hypothetical protein Emtol_2672 [Emticicia oligotrophica DSM 17448]
MNKTKNLYELCRNINQTNAPMLIFNITFNVEDKINEQWLKWMKSNFIPVALSTNLPKDIKVFRLLNEQANTDKTFAFQFHFKNMEDYMEFEMQHRERISDRYQMLFRGKYVEFSSLLQEA